MQSTVWVPSSDRCCSKSNITLLGSALPSYPTSPIAILAVEEQADVLLNCLFQGSKLEGPAGAAQIVNRSFGEILIFIAKQKTAYDIFDARGLRQAAKHRLDHVAKAAGLAAADVEYAADFRAREKPCDHLDHVGDIDEVPSLVAVGNARFVRLEEAHCSAVARDIEGLREHAHHFALVVLIGAEYVEELHPDPLRRQVLPFAEPVEKQKIKQMFAPAIEIQGLEPPQRLQRDIVAKARGPIAVGGGRRGIDKPRAGGGAPIKQSQ